MIFKLEIDLCNEVHDLVTFWHLIVKLEPNEADIPINGYIRIDGLVGLVRIIYLILGDRTYDQLHLSQRNLDKVRIYPFLAPHLYICQLECHQLFKLLHKALLLLIKRLLIDNVLLVLILGYSQLLIKEFQFRIIYFEATFCYLVNALLIRHRLVSMKVVNDKLLQQIFLLSFYPGGVVFRFGADPAERLSHNIIFSHSFGALVNNQTDQFDVNSEEGRQLMGRPFARHDGLDKPINIGIIFNQGGL